MFKDLLGERLAGLCPVRLVSVRGVDIRQPDFMLLTVLIDDDQIISVNDPHHPADDRAMMAMIKPDRRQISEIVVAQFGDRNMDFLSVGLAQQDGMFADVGKRRITLCSPSRSIHFRGDGITRSGAAAATGLAGVDSWELPDSPEPSRGLIKPSGTFGCRSLGEDGHWARDRWTGKCVRQLRLFGRCCCRSDGDGRRWLRCDVFRA